MRLPSRTLMDRGYYRLRNFQGSLRVCGCCCLVNRAARIVVITEFVFVLITVLCSVMDIAQGTYLRFLDLVFGLISGGCLIGLNSGIDHQKSSLLLPFLIWKPVEMACDLTRLLYFGITAPQRYVPKLMMSPTHSEVSKNYVSFKINSAVIVVLVFSCAYLVTELFFLYIVWLCHLQLTRLKNRQRTIDTDVDIPGIIALTTAEEVDEIDSRLD